MRNLRDSRLRSRRNRGFYGRGILGGHGICGQPGDSAPAGYAANPLDVDRVAFDESAENSDSEMSSANSGNAASFVPLSFPRTNCE